MLGTILGIYLIGFMVTVFIVLFLASIKAEISDSEYTAYVIFWPIVLCLFATKGLVITIKKSFKQGK